MSRWKLNDSQRKVYNACRNGWLVGGNYRAIFDNHEREFFADSPTWLFREVHEWFASHAMNHADAGIVVKFNA